MGALIMTVLGALVRIAGIEHARLAIHRYVTAAMIAMVAAIAAIAAIGYALGAVWEFLLPKVGPGFAYLIIAGVLALISVILALIARGAARGKYPPVARSALPALPVISGGRFSGTGITGLASAAIAGFIVGLVGGRR